MLLRDFGGAAVAGDILAWMGDRAAPLPSGADQAAELPGGNALPHQAHAAIAISELGPATAGRTPVAAATGVVSLIPASARGALGELDELTVSVNFVTTTAHAAIATHDIGLVPVPASRHHRPWRDGLFTEEDGVGGAVLQSGDGHHLAPAGIGGEKDQLIGGVIGAGAGPQAAIVVIPAGIDGVCRRALLGRGRAPGGHMEGFDR